jgi:NAD(P)-dependent dehydrogenase (short-subunit alcohol dehydrogenase family)
MINPMDLMGKHILITGASSGIGKATAIHLSKLGARLTLIARDEKKLKDTLKLLEGQGHVFYSFDLKEIELIENIINKVVDKGGSLDGLVHCAGIGTMRPLRMTKYEFLHEMMLINYYSFVELIRCVSKKNNYREGASFVGMSSIASLHGDKSKTGYCSSKAAMDAAMRCMAKELANKNIRVNTVVAGLIKTEMYNELVDNTGEEAVEKNMQGQYLGMGETIDIANAMAYLLSDASKFITGTGLVVDGGYLS